MVVPRGQAEPVSESRSHIKTAEPLQDKNKPTSLQNIDRRPNNQESTRRVGSSTRLVGGSRDSGGTGGTDSRLPFADIAVREERR